MILGAFFHSRASLKSKLGIGNAGGAISLAQNNLMVSDT